MSRLFIAISIRAGRPLRQALQALEAADSRVRAVQPGQLHLTLRFLGEIADETVPAIAEAVDAAAAEHRAFPMLLAGLDQFPGSMPRRGRLTHRPSPRVVFSPVDEPVKLVALAADVNERLAGLDLPAADGRPFHPHVTLARIKPPKRGRRRERRARAQAAADRHAPSPNAQLNAAVHEVIDAYRGRVLYAGVAGEVELIESALTPTGPVYASRHVAKLG